MPAQPLTPPNREPASTLAYEIYYRDAAGKVIRMETVRCAAEKQARILAHALRPEGMRRLEVWRGPYLIYERPQTQQAARRRDLQMLPRLFAAE